MLTVNESHMRNIFFPLQKKKSLLPPFKKKKEEKKPKHSVAYFWQMTNMVFG